MLYFSIAPPPLQIASSLLLNILLYQFWHATEVVDERLAQAAVIERGGGVIERDDEELVLVVLHPAGVAVVF